MWYSIIRIAHQDHHGACSYVLPGESLDENLTRFIQKISTLYLPTWNWILVNFLYMIFILHHYQLFAGSQSLLWVAIAGWNDNRLFIWKNDNQTESLLTRNKYLP
jgi:hypothetical protein